jgi:hypothetical protein
MLQPAPVQTTYTRYIGPAQVGMLASEVNWAADTRIIETVAGIGFGLAVSQGVADDGCIIGGAAFVGLTMRDVTLPRSETLTLDAYARYDNAAILTMGDLWVLCYASVTPATASVVFEAATGKLGIAGTTIAHARWMSTAVGSAGTPVLAVLRLGDISSR